MRLANTHTLSFSAPNKLFACLVVCMIKLLYNPDIQVITTSPNKLQAEVAYRLKPAVCWLYARSCAHPFISQSVCALLHNKYIFWLGKNMFDRTTATFSRQGLAGGSRLKDKAELDMIKQLEK